MTLMPSGSAGARPSLDDLIQLLAQSGAGGSASPYGGSGQPAGLFGSGYRAFMARQAPGQMAAAGGQATGSDTAAAAAGLPPAVAQADLGGDFDWAPAVRAMSAPTGSRGASPPIQVAANELSCPTCHSKLPPAVTPGATSPAPRIPVPPGMDALLLPPPLSMLVNAARGAGVLSGPQAAQAPNIGSGSRRAHREFRQCDIQSANDEIICDAISPYDLDSRRCCWESRNNRYAHCTSSDGEVAYPRLNTQWDPVAASCYPEW
jgi:hypothetical protein